MSALTILRERGGGAGWWKVGKQFANKPKVNFGNNTLYG